MPQSYIPQNITEWMTWGAVVIPLFAFAWSSIRFVVNKVSERKNTENLRVEYLIRLVNNSNGDGIILQLYAIDQLKRYRRLRFVLISIIDTLIDNWSQNLLLNKALYDLRRSLSYGFVRHCFQRMSQFRPW